MQTCMVDTKNTVNPFIVLGLIHTDTQGNFLFNQAYRHGCHENRPPPGIQLILLII